MNTTTANMQPSAKENSNTQGFDWRGRNFLNTMDFPPEAIMELVERALSMKHEGYAAQPLAGTVVGLIFFNPSLRTKTSMASGVARLGGTTIDLTVGQGTYAFEFKDGVVMNGATQEHIKEAAPVLAQYCEILAVRSSELVTSGSAVADSSATWALAKQDTVVRSFAKYAGVPVVNLESNAFHPCQGIGDALTLKEQFGETRKKKYVLTWAYHPKPLPTATPHSQLLAACDMGCDVTLAFPEGWDLDGEVMAAATERVYQAGGSLQVSHSMHEAAQGADIICAKSWGALSHYGDWDAEKAIREDLKHWIVNEEIMALTNNARFMHCLPTRRNVEVTDGVLDSPNSIVVSQAGNRMYAQNALLVNLLGK
ncbi:MAG: N-acetylornithine carbamoyltransferase [Chloroflexia bacterium]